MKNRNIDKIVSKVLKETLESKIEGIESDIKNLTELGGMPSDVYDDEHPFKNVNFGKMTNREIEQLMSKHMGNEDEEEIEDEEYDEDNISAMYGDDYEEDEEEELEEGFDDDFIKKYRDDEDFSEKEFKPMPLGKGEIGIDQNKLDRNTGVTIEKEFEDDFLDSIDLRQLMGGDITGDDDDDLEPMTEGAQVCNECGSNSLMEGECSECGYKMESEMEEGIYDVDDIDNESNEFDYVQEDLDFDEYDTDPREPNEERCKATLEIMRQGDCDYCEELLQRDNCNAITESLTKRQKRTLDKNKNNKIDAEDFKLLRKGKKKETKEGKKFPDLSGDGKVTKKDILMGRGVKFGKKKTKLKESIQLSEEEMIDLIENIIKEQKSKETKLRPIGKPRGLETYEKAHKGSGKENEDYIKSVAKKMKDYLKDGSKGEYETSPKHFPKGNGQLEKMKSKKYTMSKDGSDFIDDFARPGMENLDYDEIHPDENWMKDTIEGSSRTGNNPKWVNAEETELGEKINKKRKENKLAKAKRMAYNKSAQPVISDKTGEGDGKGLNIKLESENVKQLKMLNEEFSKISNLISYNRKTQ
jgi:hypothetical protein